MGESLITEGTVSFHVPEAGRPCNTYYKIVGDLDSGKTPLIAVHGGPGSAHECILSLTDLTEEHSIPIIFYDQIGCGQSTHLPEKNGDEDFWAEKLFHNELENLIEKLGIRERGRGFDILGQSWGGMIGSTYAAQSPKGLRKLILVGVPASMELRNQAVNMLISRLPQSVQDAMDKCVKEGKMDSAEYREAQQVFNQKHLCQVKPWPAPEVAVGLKWIMSDPTVYMTINRPVRLLATGTLKDWSVIGKIHKIKTSTLLINGSDDQAQDICVEPFFKLLDKVKWVTIQNSSHFPYIEQREKFMKIVGDFLQI